jgi:hypothetical protein
MQENFCAVPQRRFIQTPFEAAGIPTHFSLNQSLDLQAAGSSAALQVHHRQA